MAITASALRQNIFKLLEHISQTGEPLVVTHKGHRLTILSQEKSSDKFSRLAKHSTIQGEAQELADLDMSGTWSGGSDL